MENNMLRRLGNDDYERPKQTLQEKMSDVEVGEKLRDYVKVESIMDIDVGTHVRYFKNENGEMKFRLGGNIIKKDTEGRYVVLSNGKASWSASTNACIFYRKLTLADLREIHNREKKEYEEAIIQYKQKVNLLKKELVKYKKAS